jgi:hypothetical protein
MHTSASVPIPTFRLSSVHPVTQAFGENRGMDEQLKNQVGVARVITDRATCAYIGDVFILESHCGHGLSKLLRDKRH